jgi:mRNA deadenylase 3'-5' endonuclease subunit Ccr4
MFYVLNLDHHGYYQGVYNKFETKQEAKSYLDTKKDTIRVGCIGYRVSNKSLLCNIIFESSATDVEFNEYSGYDASDDSVFHADMDNILHFVETYKDIISDNIFE